MIYRKGLGIAGLMLVCSVVTVLAPFEAQAKSKPRAEWADSPLPVELQGQLDRAGKLMKAGKYDKAKPMILSALESANDVPKCLAIATYTEPYAFPMLEIRRKCCTRALTLCNNEDDFLLMALKARRYQFFEITRESISKMIENARTVPQLYNLARKSQEVSMNDVSHMAMEKASTGIRTGEEWLVYAENCKALGYDDLLRKAIKLLVDDEDESIPLCDIALRVQRYGMRDEVRYALKKALDKVSPDLATATREMAEISEAARRLNEPDIKTRADFFVKKGNYMLKQKGLAEEASARERAEQERIKLDEARLRDRERESGFVQEPGAQSQPLPPSKPSSGY